MVREPLTPEQREYGRQLGSALRAARGTRALTDVAVAAGISPETLRKIETGRIVTPSFAAVAAVTRALGLSLDEVAAELTDRCRQRPTG